MLCGERGKEKRGEIEIDKQREKCREVKR